METKIVDHVINNKSIENQTAYLDPSLYTASSLLAAVNQTHHIISSTKEESTVELTQSKQTNSLKRNVIYYSNWSMYDPEFPTFASDIPIDTVTDVNYAFMNVDNNGAISLSDPWSDIQYATNWSNPDQSPYWGNLRMLSEVKQKARTAGKDFNTFFSVGGWGREAPLEALASNQSSIERFIESAVEMCKTYDFDGIDLDWEYPVGGENPKNFVNLLTQLRKRFDEEGLLITIASAAGPDNFESLDWKTISKCCDRINIMTYDYHGPWPGNNDLVTNHQSPIDPTDAGDKRFNITSTLNLYKTAGTDMSKVCIGVPLYFRTYGGVKGGQDGSHVYSPYSGEGTGKGVLLWRKVMEDVRLGKAIGYWDLNARAYSVYYPNEQVFATGADLDHTIPIIADLVQQMNLAGIMSWEFKGDDAEKTATNRIFTLLNPNS